jgi:hypothetical protein
MLPEQARGLGPSAVAMGTDCGGTAAGGAVAAPCGMVSFLIAALLAAYSALHWLPVLTTPAGADHSSGPARPASVQTCLFFCSCSRTQIVEVVSGDVHMSSVWRKLFANRPAPAKDAGHSPFRGGGLEESEVALSQEKTTHAKLVEAAPSRRRRGIPH